ncbi:DUF6624 domain-containing protein [Luteibacter aegosomatissinici]|uniref:DUF6624 domain-containing protein n=1 Tax=Luteibacter aegosomatissinici TaxID=2911539 RepID=UPI001FF773D9|nr:DUF6624 domain-containing protein [Luteibacter aegosomatissinici]UPG94511.1 hypothetical protein L2Y97_22280 [Luteibacter aegosomatissinici]
MYPAFVRRCVVAALSLTAASAAFADAKEDAVKAKCPAVVAWTEKMAKAHPALSDEGVERDNKAGGFSDPDLRDELRKRLEADQVARNAWIASPQDKARYEAMDKVDKDNLAWMKEHFSKKGFPHANAVGLAGVNAAFILVQHAVADVPFMQSMLPQITARGEAGELSKSDVAMLIDRLLRQAGKPQRYGTQYAGTNMKDLSDMKMDPVEDPAHLDERRASMDLMPHADYECALRIFYAPDTAPAPASSTAH